MKPLTNLMLAITILIGLMSCSDDDDNYPKTGIIEEVRKTLQPYYIDVKSVPNEPDIDKPLLIHSYSEMENLFSSLSLEIPPELQDLTFKDETFIFISHLTKYKDVDLIHNLSYDIKVENGNYHYRYDITELYNPEDVSNEEETYRYYSGVIIRGIFNSSNIELSFKEQKKN